MYLKGNIMKKKEEKKFRYIPILCIIIPIVNIIYMVNLMYKTNLTKTLKRLFGCVLIYNLQLLLVLAVQDQLMISWLAYLVIIVSTVLVVMMLVNWIRPLLMKQELPDQHVMKKILIYGLIVYPIFINLLSRTKQEYPVMLDIYLGLTRLYPLAVEAIAMLVVMQAVRKIYTSDEGIRYLYKRRFITAVIILFLVIFNFKFVLNLISIINNG